MFLKICSRPIFCPRGSFTISDDDKQTNEGRKYAAKANWRGVNYFQMLVKLVHQAGEELVSVLLFSDVQLLVPHLENLQHERFEHIRTQQHPHLVIKTHDEEKKKNPSLL